MWPSPLPPPRICRYQHVTLDFGRYVAVYPDGRTKPLVGNACRLLELLTEYPNRLLTYWQIGQVLLPELVEQRGCEGLFDLGEQEQEEVRAVIHMTVWRARRVLGERPGGPSIIESRAGIGYLIVPWLEP